MNARALLAGMVSSSLLVVGCAHRAATPDAASPAIEVEVGVEAERRPPPGTRIDTWPDLGAWSVTGRELPGSGDIFLWEKAAAPAPPKAQVPLRLHRPVE
jgi:hypothetical protein